MKEINMKVLIGIPTYNGAQRIDYLLQSIYNRNTDIEYKILICDDSGNEKHRDLVNKIVNRYSSVENIGLIVNNKNLGVASSWNRIIRYSGRDDVIILINDDVIVAKDSIKNLAFLVGNNENIGAAAYECYNIKEEDMYAMSLGILPLGTKIDPKRSLVAWGAFWGFTKYKYDLVGGFDEYYHAYYEETDFCTYLANKGYINCISKCPRSYHVISATLKHFDYQDLVNKSYRHYMEKWGYLNTDNILSRIPIQRVKWLCNNQMYESEI